ncbi:hypothetical protein KM043_000110 [Ampulex compressa]|nr:hypothetical protein KM043_000110 [Ampulex compressa]
MESTFSNNIPYVGKSPCEVIPTTSSDRAKSSVDGAGAQDSEEMLGEGTPDQKIHESSCTDNLQRFEEAIERLLEMLEDKQQSTTTRVALRER